MATNKRDVMHKM